MALSGRSTPLLQNSSFNQKILNNKYNPIIFNLFQFTLCVIAHKYKFEKIVCLKSDLF